MAFSKRKVPAFVAGVMSLTLIVGSWAFYHNEATIDNNLSTKDGFGSRTIEEFVPDQELEPGSEITKVVGVMNTGDYDLVVRIRMKESWKRNNLEFIGFDSADPEFNTVVQGGTAPNYTYTANQADDTDGLVAGDETVVYKNMDLTNWIDGGDGYWYYNKKLPAKASTGNLLKSLVLADNTDMGFYTQSEMYSTVDPKLPALVTAQNKYDTALAAYTANPTDANKTALENAQKALDAIYKWTATKPANEKDIRFIKAENTKDDTRGGYAGADYTLSIITETCQATAEAVDAEWAAAPVPTAVRTAWGL